MSPARTRNYNLNLWLKTTIPHLPVSHEYKGGDTIEDGHHEVGQGEVDQKVVGDAPHSSVGWGGECNKSSHNISSKLKIKTKLQKYFVLNNKQ